MKNTHATLLFLLGFIFSVMLSCQKESGSDANIVLDNSEFIKFDYDNTLYDLQYKHKSGGFEVTNSLDGFFGVKNSLIFNRQNSNNIQYSRATLVFENLNPDTLKTFPLVFPFSVQPFQTGAKLYFTKIGVVDTSIFSIDVRRNFSTAINLGGVLNISINDTQNGLLIGSFSGTANNGKPIKNGSFHVRYKK